MARRGRSAAFMAKIRKMIGKRRKGKRSRRGRKRRYRRRGSKRANKLLRALRNKY